MRYLIYAVIARTFDYIIQKLVATILKNDRVMSRIINQKCKNYGKTERHN